jgi:hypothetical protein
MSALSSYHQFLTREGQGRDYRNGKPTSFIRAFLGINPENNVFDLSYPFLRDTISEALDSATSCQNFVLVICADLREKSPGKTTCA